MGREQEAIEKIVLTKGDLDECYKKWPKNDNLSMFQLVSRKTIEKMIEAGYRLPSEQTDKREAIAQSIYFHGEETDLNKWDLLRPNQRDMYFKITDRILSLLPTPEMKVLSDEEIRHIISDNSHLRPSIRLKAIAQAQLAADKGEE